MFLSKQLRHRYMNRHDYDSYGHGFKRNMWKKFPSWKGWQWKAEVFEMSFVKTLLMTRLDRDDTKYNGDKIFTDIFLDHNFRTTLSREK